MILTQMKERTQNEKSQLVNANKSSITQKQNPKMVKKRKKIKMQRRLA